MKQNVASWDRGMRAVAAIALLACAVVAPYSLTVRLSCGAMGMYLMFSAVAGTCLGYRLMGRSTCPVK
jgi:hypothetical protein